MWHGLPPKHLGYLEPQVQGLSANLRDAKGGFMLESPVPHLVPTQNAIVVHIEPGKIVRHGATHRNGMERLGPQTGKKHVMMWWSVRDKRPLLDRIILGWFEI